MSYKNDSFAVLRMNSNSLLNVLYHNSLFKSMLCGAKLPFLFSFHSYLFSGNNNLREERRMKREKWKEQKETTIFCRKLSFLFGAGSGGRTRTVSLPLDFESSTSANSIIPAIIIALCYRARCIISHCFSFCKRFFTLDARLTYYFFVV